MPWTRRQVRFLESSGSPLTAAQKSKMNSELHSDPSMGHKKKGSKAMKKESAQKLDHMRITPAENGGHTVEHHYKVTMKGDSGAFMAHHEPATHVFGKGEGKKMMAHLKEHLGIGAAAAAGSQEKEVEPAGHEPSHEKDAAEEELSEGE